MTILVTGSAGHLGEALMRTLRATGRPVRGIDIKASPYTDATGSIADADFVRQAMAGVDAVIHTATLHKPHVATHAGEQFADTNVKGTLLLLEEAVAAGVCAFVFTSTTSAFGSALSPALGEPAVWIDEDVVPVPKNIYGATKVAAESLCELVFRRDRLPVIVLRTSRFFPEADDEPAMRASYATENAQANELLYRRVDIEDVVTAHLQALEKAPDIGFSRYIVSATTPFSRGDLADLRNHADEVVRRLFPECAALYSRRRWQMFSEIDRVYDNGRARRDLGWRPRHDFRHVIDSLAADADFRSELALVVGIKGYHAGAFEEGPYPVTRSANTVT